MNERHGPDEKEKEIGGFIVGMETLMTVENVDYSVPLLPDPRDPLRGRFTSAVA